MPVVPPRSDQSSRTTRSRASPTAFAPIEGPQHVQGQEIGIALVLALRHQRMSWRYSWRCRLHCALPGADRRVGRCPATKARRLRSASRSEEIRHHAADQHRIADRRADLLSLHRLRYRRRKYARASARLGAERAPAVSKAAVVLDIDETSLSNWDEIYHNKFAYIPSGACDLKSTSACGQRAWELSARATALQPTLDLFNFAKGLKDKDGN